MKTWPRLLLTLALWPAVSVHATPPTAVPASELRALAEDAERELRANILPFWLKHAPHPSGEGFNAFVSVNLEVDNDQPRGALLTCRLLWTFSAAHQQHPDPAYLALAQRAWRDLTTHFLDREHGGVFWSVGPDGRPLETHKQVYVQVFAIYGLTEYYRATGETAALDQAIALYRLIEQHTRDPVHGGYFDALDRQWVRQRTNLLGPAEKSQNSHIHILEGFTNLLRVWPDAGLRARHRELIELVLTRIIDPRTSHLVLFMRDDWTPVGDEISYGHDIELSWLLVEAAEVAGDPALLDRARRAAVAMAEATLARGLDTDGGVYNEGDPHGPTNTNKEWWEQAEAAVGFLNAYQISGDARFYAQARRSWTFIQERMVDREHGDWHNTLRRDGTPILEITTRLGQRIPSAKLSVWKCPYHNSRACLQLIERLEALAR
ncbi:Cellobiose 2-epimerase [Lacunisphaera limnophila]|uniref:Cellobiose 2-epimerase n=1 Tax=Lacunisphaera limnophila TaxID=1838286 RepID=A0A1D8AVV9_9BACT|nr:AGE family epimerase/isomerase [Lacunisphaera limnophila]AOS45023.1 Cellobiose 2-epimerase [Lacunisphaera limnophila]